MHFKIPDKTVTILAILFFVLMKMLMLMPVNPFVCKCAYSHTLSPPSAAAQVGAWVPTDSVCVCVCEMVQL